MPTRTQTKQKKLGDYIDVWFKDVGDGIAAKVYRTDESDAEWEAKKAQAASRAKGTPAEWKSMPEKADPSKDEIVLQGGKIRIPRGPLSDKEWGDRVRQASSRKDWDSYTVNGFKVTPKGKTVEDWTPEETRQMAKSLNEADRDRAALDEKDAQRARSTTKAILPDGRVIDVRPAEVVPSDGNTDVKPAKVEPADKKPSGPGMNPAAIAMEMVKGATPATPMSAVTDAMAEKPLVSDEEKQRLNDLAENVGQTTRETLATPIVGAAKVLTNAPREALGRLDRVAGGGPLITPEEQGLIGAVTSIPVQAAGKAIAAGGAALGLPNIATKGAEMYLGAKEGLANTMPSGVAPGPEFNNPMPDPATPPPAGNFVMAPGVPGAPVGAGGGAGASVSGEAKMPGFGYTPMLVDQKPLKDAAAAYGEKVEGVLREQRALADEHAAMAADIVQKNNEAMAATDELTKQQIARQQTLQAEQNRMMAAYQSKMDEQERVSAQGIDPGRYWANKSVGQKAAAVVAGALFGFTGQGMQWLQRLDGLVAEDNRLQESDLNRKIAGLDRSAKGLLVQADFLDKTATRDNAMLEMAKAQKYKESEMYLRNFSLTTQSMELKQKALTMAEMLAGKQFEIQQNLTQLAQHNAAAVNQARAHNAAQAAEMYRFKLAQDAKANKNADGKIMLGAQAQEAGRLAGSVEIAKQLQQEFGVKGIPARLMDKVAALFPGTEATNYNTKAQLAIQMIGPLAGSGVLSEKEYDRWEKMIAQAGDINGEARLDALVSELQTKYVQHIAALKKAGYDTSAFEQSLMSGGGSGGPPSYARPN